MSIVNVKDFGAVGNGKADDTAAIKAAIAAAEAPWFKKELYFPSGEYAFSQPLAFNGIKVTGAGWNNTILKLTKSVGKDVPAIYFAKGDVEKRVIFRDIQVSSGYKIHNAPVGTSPSDSNGIQLNSSTHLDGVMVRGFHKGVVLNADHNTVSHCYIIECYYGVYFHNDQGDNYLHDCVITGHKFASIACWRMRDTLMIRNHLGYSPYGIYQVPFTDELRKDFFMHDVRLMHTRFEACGNGAIYSENWNHGVDAGGLIHCRFENVGYSQSLSFKLPDKPADYVVQVGHCKGMNYYYPGGTAFREGQTHKNIWYVHFNNASWFGDFALSDFDFGGGYRSSLYPDRQQAAVTNGSKGGNIRTTVVKHRGTSSNELRPYAAIYIKLSDFSDNPGVPIPLVLPKNTVLSGGNVPFMVTANNTGLPNSSITIQGNGIYITMSDSSPRTGLIKLEGELQ